MRYKLRQQEEHTTTTLVRVLIFVKYVFSLSCKILSFGLSAISSGEVTNVRQRASSSLTVMAAISRVDWVRIGPCQQLFTA